MVLKLPIRRVTIPAIATLLNVPPTLSLGETAFASGCGRSNGGRSPFHRSRSRSTQPLCGLSSSSSSSFISSGATGNAYSSATNTMATSSSSSSSFSSPPSSLEVHQFPCLSDNYGYLIHDASTGCTAAIDTPDADAYRRELDRRGWTLTHILNTHHHWDHTGGNDELKKSPSASSGKGGVTVIGPEAERGRIPGMDVGVKGGDTVSFGQTEATVLDVGGHTSGHIAYYFPRDGTVFVGDSLFALGCGRMFEGTPEQFWSSLKRLRSLPDDTIVYCAHEYTESNAKFAMNVEPNNPDLVERCDVVKSKRSNGEPTVPSVLGDEKKTNPFLRVDVSNEIRLNVGASANDSDESVFAKVRKAKDNFRG